MLNKIKFFLKRYWIFIVLAAVASGLLLVRLNQRGQPVPEAQPTPTPQLNLSLLKITGAVVPLNTKVIFQEFSFPTRLKTYRAEKNELTSDQASRIAQELRFSGSAQRSEDVFLGTFYTWSTKTNYLSIALKAIELDYGVDLTQMTTPKQGNLPSPQVAINTLEDLLNKFELKPEFELKWQKEAYLSKGYYLQPTQPEQADFISVGANPTIGQHQLVGLDPTSPLISLILNKNKEVVRFQYQVYFSSFEGQETYNLKTKKEVESALLSEGRIVYFGTYQESVKAPKITQAEFNQITLAYYQEPEKNLVIQPIYILSGQGTLENGETTEIIAYLPAIKFGTQTQENIEVPREFFQLPELP